VGGQRHAPVILPPEKRPGTYYYYCYHHYLLYAGYLYISSWDNVPKEYNVTAILSLLFMAPIWRIPALTLMYFYISTFRSVCAVPNIIICYYYYYPL
jgi:hypothetical protein